jgi:outer membrane protein assembly factor BamB
MKTVGGKRSIQIILLATIVALVGYSIFDNLYGPFPSGNGFPLKPVWETKLNDNIKQAIPSENGHILIRLGYSVDLLSAETGDLLWKYRVDVPIYSIASYKGIIYVIGKNTLFTIDEGTGDLLWQQSMNISAANTEIKYVDENSIVIRIIGGVVVFNSKTGELNARTNFGNGIADTCIYQDKLYIFRHNVSVYDIATGNFLWDDLSDQYPNNTVCENGIAYFSEAPSRLSAYDLEKRSILWSNAFLLPETGIVDIYISPNFLFVDGVGEFFIVDKDQGKVIHSSPSAGHTASITVIRDNLFVFYMHEQAIYSYDIHTWKNTGKLRYSLSTIFGSEVDRFLRYGDQLILWKGKCLFLYE